MEETQRLLVFASAPLGSLELVAISLVDDEAVREFENALLDALELVARAGL